MSLSLDELSGVSGYRPLPTKTQSLADFVSEELGKHNVSLGDFVKTEYFQEFKKMPIAKSVVDEIEGKASTDEKKSNPGETESPSATIEPVPDIQMDSRTMEAMTRMRNEVVRPAVVISVDPTIPPFRSSYVTSMEVSVTGAIGEQLRSEFMMKFPAWSNSREFERVYLDTILAVRDKYDYLPHDIPEEVNKNNLEEKMVTVAAGGVPIADLLNGTMIRGDRYRMLHANLSNRGRDTIGPEKVKWQDRIWMHKNEASMLRRNQRLYDAFRVDVKKYHEMWPILNTVSMSLAPLPVWMTGRARDRYWKLKLHEGTIVGPLARRNPPLQEWLVLGMREQLRGAVGMQYKDGSGPFRSLLTAMHVRTNEFRKVNDVPGKLSKNGAEKFLFDAMASIVTGEFCNIEWPMSGSAMADHDFTVVLDIIVNKLVSPRQIWFPEDIIRMHNYLAYHFMRMFDGPARRRTAPFPSFDPITEKEDKLKELLEMGYWGGAFTLAAEPFLLHFLDRGRTKTFDLGSAFNDFRNRDRAISDGVWYDMDGFTDLNEDHPRMNDFIGFYDALRGLTATADAIEVRDFRALLGVIKEQRFQFRRMIRNINLMMRQAQVSSLAYPVHPSFTSKDNPLKFSYTYMSSFSALMLGEWDLMNQKRFDPDYYKYTWEVHRTAEQFSTYFHFYRDGLSSVNTSKREIISMAKNKTVDKVGFVRVIEEGVLGGVTAEALFVPRLNPEAFYSQSIANARRFVKRMEMPMGLIRHFYYVPPGKVSSRSLVDHFQMFFGYDENGSEFEFDLLSLQRAVDSNEFSSAVKETRTGRYPAIKFNIPVRFTKDEFTGTVLPSVWEDPIEVVEGSHVLKVFKWFYVDWDTFRDTRHTSWATLRDPIYLVGTNTRPFTVGDDVIPALTQTTTSLTREHTVFNDDEFIKYNLTFTG